jgi:Domain of unknown function (DUF4416)
MVCMAVPRCPDPVLLIVAAFSRHPLALEWAKERLTACFGPVVWGSLPFEFNQTRYYEPAMGTGLRKQFLVFGNMIQADGLADAKLRTNALESEAARSGDYPDKRPLNLDPGILSLGKFQLATTKDQAHRVYLRDGIFAETTLRYHAGAFEPWEWTYADYRQPIVLAFLREARDLYRGLLRSNSRQQATDDSFLESPVCAPD